MTALKRIQGVVGFVRTLMITRRENAGFVIVLVTLLVSRLAVPDGRMDGTWISCKSDCWWVVHGQGDPAVVLIKKLSGLRTVSAVFYVQLLSSEGRERRS
jgi:hypothetical protein